VWATFFGLPPLEVVCIPFLDSLPPLNRSSVRINNSVVREQRTNSSHVMIEDGGGDGAIAVKDLGSLLFNARDFGKIDPADSGPLFKGFVGGDDDRTAFLALANNLEEQVGSALIDGQVPDFIQNQQCRGEITLELAFERSLGLGSTQGIDDIDSVSEQDAVALLASSVTKSGG
jgi:hypothetical protein